MSRIRRLNLQDLLEMTHTVSNFSGHTIIQSSSFITMFKRYLVSYFISVQQFVKIITIFKRLVSFIYFLLSLFYFFSKRRCINCTTQQTTFLLICFHQIHTKCNGKFEIIISFFNLFFDDQSCFLLKLQYKIT